jgi:hypothetical protein
MRSKLLPVPFPLRGYNETESFADQPQRTTPSCLNVRAYDPRTGRNRGAQRAGLTKHIGSTVNSTNQVQYLSHVVSSNTGSPSSTSLSTRVVTPVAVAGGTIKTFAGGSFSTPTSGSAALASGVPVIYAAELFGKLYFVDGTNAKILDPVAGAVSSWTASAGSFPSHSTTNLPRLITMWRARVVMAGIKTDASNWFMSAVADATDFDYAVDPATACQAVAGNSSEAGLVPDDIVNSLFPISDHYLLFGGDHSIYLMKGDPAENGQFEKISSITGTAWGKPMCKDPHDTLYFIGSRGGVYRYQLGSRPVKLSSGALDAFFTTIDFGNTVCTAQWNEAETGVNFWLTNLDGGTSTHLFFDVRNQGFWLDQYADASMNPTATHTLDGDQSDDRITLLGGRDGYIRYLDSASSTDDGEGIDSYVYMGPVSGGPTVKVQCDQIQMQMAENTDGARYELFTGSTANEAFTKEVPILEANLKAGRNNPDRRRWNAHYAWLKLASTQAGEHWSFENASVSLMGLSSNEQVRPS